MNTMIPSSQTFPELLTGSDTGACTLEIYCNANEDDTIVMRDFTARIILWLEESAALADANFDGGVEVDDRLSIGLGVPISIKHYWNGYGIM